MNSILVTAILFGATPVDVSRPAEGSLLFSQNSKKIVEEWTNSSITHVAIVVNHDGKPWVYEAAPPKVRRVPLATYYREIGVENKKRGDDRIRIWLLTPNESLSEDELIEIRSYLKSQKGRRYSIRNYVRGKPGDGIHCAEFAANVLSRVGRCQAGAPYALNPTTLLRAITSEYSQANEVFITIEKPKKKKSWCQRSGEWWSNAFNWCGWASEECWKFCW